MELTQGMAAVVTGGASGLGKASAQALADLGLKVTIFDVNEEAGEAHAQAIGGTFARVDITDEQSVVDGFAAARAAHGQERVTVHCAMTSRRGKTLGWDKQNNCYKRLSTEDYAFGAEGILVSSYRVASLSALGMANAQPVNDSPFSPFGAVKNSGVGRFNGRRAIDAFMTTHWISVQHEKRQFPFSADDLG